MANFGLKFIIGLNSEKALKTAIFNNLGIKNQKINLDKYALPVVDFSSYWYGFHSHFLLLIKSLPRGSPG